MRLPDLCCEPRYTWQVYLNQVVIHLTKWGGPVYSLLNLEGEEYPEEPTRWPSNW